MNVCLDLDTASEYLYKAFLSIHSKKNNILQHKKQKTQVFLLALMGNKYLYWSANHFSWSREVCTCLKSIIPCLELMSL